MSQIIVQQSVSPQLLANSFGIFYQFKMTKIFILLGVIFILVGLLYPYLSNLGFGKLPGDIKIEKKIFIEFNLQISQCKLTDLGMQNLNQFFPH